jgi:hypothetical protein
MRTLKAETEFAIDFFGRLTSRGGSIVNFLTGDGLGSIKSNRNRDANGHNLLNAGGPLLKSVVKNVNSERHQPAIITARRHVYKCEIRYKGSGGRKCQRDTEGKAPKGKRFSKFK